MIGTVWEFSSCVRFLAINLKNFSQHVIHFCNTEGVNVSYPFAEERRFYHIAKRRAIHFCVN